MAGSESQQQSDSPPLSQQPPPQVQALPRCAAMEETTIAQMEKPKWAMAEMMTNEWRALRALTGPIPTNDPQSSIANNERLSSNRDSGS